MTDDVKNTKSGENKELDDLLDDALMDFDEISVPNVNVAKHSDTTDTSESQTQKDKCETSETTENEWTQEFIKQTIDEMDKNLKNMLQGDGELNELKSVFQKLEQASASNAIDGEDNINTDFESAISQALKALSVPNENLQSETDYLAAMLGQTSLDGDGDGDGLLSFVQSMMQQLLSKEMLYPSLKEVLDKYPAWLEERKESLSNSDQERYTKQLELLQKVCTELEKEKEDDAKDVKQRRFERVMSLMQEMEKFGQLPIELASTVLRSDSIGDGNFLDEITSLLHRNT